MKLRNYREATQEERVAILQALTNIYSGSGDEKSRRLLDRVKDVERIEIYGSMLNPPKRMPGAFACFGPTFDLHYDEGTKTLKIGGYLEDLYLLGNFEAENREKAKKQG